MRLTLLCLACLAAPAAAQAGDSLVLEAPGARLVLRGDWPPLPHDTMRVSFHGQPAELYGGVPLSALLNQLGVRTDSLRGASLSLRVVIEASDGYRVVLALSDLDPTLGGRRVLVANTVDGQPLPAKEAPYRLIIAGDERPSRWMRQVVTIRVREEPQSP